VSVAQYEVYRIQHSAETTYNQQYTVTVDVVLQTFGLQEITGCHSDDAQQIAVFKDRAGQLQPT
jgi:hypothetical protein